MIKVKNKTLKEILDWGINLGIAAIATVLVVIFIGRITIVEGNSMAPTLKDNNILIIQSLTQRFGGIKQGDIVVMRIPELLRNEGKFAVKRVIATEYQHVEIKDGKVYVDGEAVSEPYANGAETLADGSLYSDTIVPEGCIYVLGDNRLPGKSRDSRVFGPVSVKRVIGKCLVRIYPFRDAGAVR
jgi:signal peptidase I